MNTLRNGLEHEMDEMTDDQLLNTIDFPENMKNLNNSLPRAKYESDSIIIKKPQTSNNIEFTSKKSTGCRKITVPSLKLITS